MSEDQSCFAMSGLVDAKRLGFRAKRRSAGSKNSSIVVIGQPKHGVSQGVMIMNQSL